jgi:hypothetical protein
MLELRDNTAFKTGISLLYAIWRQQLQFIRAEVNPLYISRH